MVLARVLVLVARGAGPVPRGVLTHGWVGLDSLPGMGTNGGAATPESDLLNGRERRQLDIVRRWGTIGALLLTVGSLGADLDLLRDREDRLWTGGPVTPSELHVLHAEGDGIPGAARVAEGIWLGGDPDILHASLSKGGSARFFWISSSVAIQCSPASVVVKGRYSQPIQPW